MPTKPAIIVQGDNQPVLITSADNFLIQNRAPYPVEVCFSVGVPAADIAWHILGPNQGLKRDGLTGDVYAKSGSVVEIALTE
jgi:hypothetical protein